MRIGFAQLCRRMTPGMCCGLHKPNTGSSAEGTTSDQLAYQIGGHHKVIAVAVFWSQPNSGRQPQNYSLANHVSQTQKFSESGIPVNQPPPSPALCSERTW